MKLLNQLSQCVYVIYQMISVKTLETTWVDTEVEDAGILAQKTQRQIIASYMLGGFIENNYLLLVRVFGRRGAEIRQARPVFGFP
tara:strand:+ start:667 stop:921 length:255 start_codon:yes stop_codon:yes gene_type:complete